ncbi:hypothetical protein MNEG_6893 [Monoraphidium neglectum]|uniref:Uncharacterized protein n=1 Tax=Monoraphidium neglectum TaxID=145388 RepID=A0A0D2N4X6_9CHLO|nr:hypothetical protein MNEG_6893 [Monoraphidium neglectum]KIZ01066.1 hypothetical protein MNEG_6893 [Monoraphidium neglectum]|eukprot:XP_013900085.1 hypothetical protein MNEG_6893 [Monoraphidium neglectum]
MAGLASEVQQKLAQVLSLSAQNYMLKIRETVLEQTIISLDSCAAQGAPGAPLSSSPASSGPGPAFAAAATPGATSSGSSFGAAAAAAAAVRPNSAAATPPAQEEVSSAAPLQQHHPPHQQEPQPRSQAFLQLADAFRSLHAKLLRLAEGAGGVAGRVQGVSGSEGGDATRPLASPFPQQHALLRLFMALSPEEMHTFISTNMDSGEVESVPNEKWRQVAAAVELSPEQEQRAGVAFDNFFSNMDRVMDERRDLQRSLADAMQRAQHGNAAAAASAEGPAADAAGVAGEEGASRTEAAAAGGGTQIEAAVECEELLHLLRSNMVREDQVWNTMSWTLKTIIEPEPLGACLLQSWCGADPMRICAIRLCRPAA